MQRSEDPDDPVSFPRPVPLLSLAVAPSGDAHASDAGVVCARHCIELLCENLAVAQVFWALDGGGLADQLWIASRMQRFAQGHAGP